MSTKKIFWLFRSNIRELEYYHQYTTLQDFENNCHDFYILQLVWFLRHGHFDEAIVWRLNPKKQKIKDIVFNVNSGKLIQRWVDNFKESFNYEPPDISFFRGGFPEYCEITKLSPNHFGKKLYLGAGKRVYPQYGGNYDVILVESDNDKENGTPTIPFYKTANGNIFKSIESKREYALCWICNFEQITQKGQEFFIKTVSESSFLKTIRIVHCGNKPKDGVGLCKKYGVKNIDFAGHVDRLTLNELINHSDFGIITSNESDGCPRVITEVMMTGTPLLLREKTRLLGYYKKVGVIPYNEKNLETKLYYGMFHYDDIKREAKLNPHTRISMDTVCSMNLKSWV